MSDIVIIREYRNMYYLIILAVTALALIQAKRRGIGEAGIRLWLVAGLLCLGVELALFLSGLRTYSFWWPLELVQHAFTEGGTGLLLSVLLGTRIGLIEI
ncbi:MAG: hypothetical protein ABIF09_11340 [Gemmatimonadota bacterium]